MIRVYVQKLASHERLYQVFAQETKLIDDFDTVSLELSSKVVECSNKPWNSLETLNHEIST